MLRARCLLEHGKTKKSCKLKYKNIQLCNRTTFYKVLPSCLFASITNTIYSLKKKQSKVFSWKQETLEKHFLSVLKDKSYIQKISNFK